MSSSTRSIALSLYRQLLRYGEKLYYTDKQYFTERIRDEFVKHRNLSDNKLIEKQFQRGEELIKRNRFR